MFGIFLYACASNDLNKFEYKDGNTINEIISLKYDSAGSFSEGLAAVKLNIKWGFIDRKGNEAIVII